MTTSKKYQYTLEQIGDTWSAKITRKINSKKYIVTKEIADLANEMDAKTWAESALAELINKQKSSNTTQAQKRKESEEIKRLRSSRRAEKTEKAKNAKLAALQSPEEGEKDLQNPSEY